METWSWTAISSDCVNQNGCEEVACDGDVQSWYDLSTVCHMQHAPATRVVQRAAGLSHYIARLRSKSTVLRENDGSKTEDSHPAKPLIVAWAV